MHALLIKLFSIKKQFRHMGYFILKKSFSTFFNPKIPKQILKTFVN